MYAQLGSIIFEGLKGFTSLDSRKSPSLVQHAVIDGKPKLQRTGDNLDEVMFDMTFHSRFCNPESEVRKLNTAMDSGEIMALITGSGETLGNFVVSGIEESVKHTTKTGAIILTTLSVTLLESAGEDILSQAMSAAKGIAFANAGNTPKTVPFTSFNSTAVLATQKLTEAVSLQRAGTLNLSLAESSSDVRANELRKAQKAFEGVEKSIESFEGAFGAVQSAVANAAAIQSAAATAKTYAQSVITAVKAADISSAVSSNRDLRNGLGDLKFQSSSLVTLVATRRI